MADRRLDATSVPATRPAFSEPVHAGRRRLRHGLSAVAVVAALALAAGALYAQWKPGTRVRGFPSPGDKPEGLAWDGAALWCNNFNGGSLYKLDPADGRVLAHYQGAGLPGSPEGLAWDGQYLWTCDWHYGLIVKFRERAGGIEIALTRPKPPQSGPSVGLEWDGKSLWLTCWPEVVKGLEFGQLYELDPATLAVRRSLVLPVRYVEDLAWDGRYFWSADWLNGIGFAIEPSTGDTLHTYRTPGPFPVGQAWDGKYLWVTDTERDSIWALDMSGATAAAPSSWSRVKELFRGR